VCWWNGGLRRGSHQDLVAELWTPKTNNSDRQIVSHFCQIPKTIDVVVGTVQDPFYLLTRPIQIAQVRIYFISTQHELHHILFTQTRLMDATQWLTDLQQGFHDRPHIKALRQVVAHVEYAKRGMH
jgi:hypothetical protein